ncbi:hypothetical protein CCACVL1_06927 [Corchorus capsularis]|uniref:Transposase (putative) gypsy type domain-containing protein n=1 Tax=Corchorus capsularis TaxID=210143 RepID=A0A1R3JB92_COCAP|nr:hypothetical protein CCACVL1_06927 [Corchorus capsularis]
MVCADGWYGRCTDVVIFPGSDPGCEPIPLSAVKPGVRLGKCSTGGTNNCPQGVRGVIQWPPERLRYIKLERWVGFLTIEVTVEVVEVPCYSDDCQVLMSDLTLRLVLALVFRIRISNFEIQISNFGGLTVAFIGGPIGFRRVSPAGSGQLLYRSVFLARPIFPPHLGEFGLTWFGLFLLHCVDFLAMTETANPGGPAHPIDLSDTDSSSDSGLTEMTDIEKISSLVLPSKFGLRVPSVSMSESEEVSISLSSEGTAMNDSSGGSAGAESQSGSTESGGPVPRRQGSSFTDEMATNVVPILTFETAPGIMVRLPEVVGSGANVAGGSGEPSAAAGSNEERSSSGSLASSVDVAEEDRFVRYNAETTRHFPTPAETSSSYIRGPNTPGAQLSRRAARAAACKFGLGPESGFRLFYPREEDRIFHIRRNSRRIFLYRSMFEAGFRLPGHPFYWQVLKSYGLGASQVTSNGWVLLVGVSSQVINSQAFVLTPKEKMQMEYFDRHHYDGKEVVLASRLVHAGLGPRPYLARSLRPAYVVVENGQVKDVERRIIVNVRGYPPTYIPSPDPSKPFQIVEYDPCVWAGTEWADGAAPPTPPPAGHRCAGKDMMTLRALELARVRHQGDRSSSASGSSDGPSGSSQAMNPQKLAEAQRRVAESRQKQLQSSGTPASVPAGAPSLFSSGIFSGGGFGDWVHRDQDATPNSLLDLLANFFAHGMSFGSPSDYEAVRGLGGMERSVFALAAVMQVNFAEYEESFRSVAPSLARLIDERMPAQNINQGQTLARERDNALQEVSELGDKLKELKAKYKETDRTLRRERDDHRSELQRREAEERKLKIRIAELKHENVGCYAQIVYEKEKSRDSALPQVQGFSDFAGIPFEKEEVPNNYPSPEPAPPLVLPEFGDSSQAAQAPVATDAAADGDDFAEDHRVLSERMSGRDADRH